MRHALVNGLGSVPRLSLSDLPLGDGTVWSIGEKQVDAAAPDGLEEHIVSVLPAWSAQTDVDLRDDEALGFTAAARAVAEALAPGPALLRPSRGDGPLQRRPLRGRRRNRPRRRHVSQGSTVASGAEWPLCASRTPLAWSPPPSTTAGVITTTQLRALGTGSRAFSAW